MATDEKDDLVRLRTKILELHQMGALHPQSFGTYQQTLLQVYNEANRQRISCRNRANEFRKQADGLDQQANAYSMMGSILFNVVNGYVEIEQKRLREEHERELEEKGELPTHSASGEKYGNDDETEKPKPKTRRRSKKKPVTEVVATEEETKSSE